MIETKRITTVCSYCAVDGTTPRPAGLVSDSICQLHLELVRLDAGLAPWKRPTPDSFAAYRTSVLRARFLSLPSLPAGAGA